MKYNEKDILNLQERLDVLRKNIENIPPDEQEGKYKGALDKLRAEIEDMIYNCIHSLFVYGWVFMDNDTEKKEKILNEAHEYIDAVCFNKVNKKKLLDITFTYYDQNMLYATAGIILSSMELDIYYPYWQAHCLSVKENDGPYTYYNEIIDMYWNQKSKQWQNQTNIGFAIYGNNLSPIYEEAVSKYEGERENDINTITKIQKKVKAA